MSPKKEKLGSVIPVGDSESLKGPTESLHGEGALHRQLKNRHVAMISIGGVIGTGTFSPKKKDCYWKPCLFIQVYSWAPLAL